MTGRPMTAEEEKIINEKTKEFMKKASKAYQKHVDKRIKELEEENEELKTKE